VRPTDERSWSNDGRETVCLVEREIVPASVLENLQPGQAWVRVPPIESRRAPIEPVRVALPTPVIEPQKTQETLPSPGDIYGTASEGTLGHENENGRAAVP
jgi:hypothetical protein